MLEHIENAKGCQEADNQKYSEKNQKVFEELPHLKLFPLLSFVETTTENCLVTRKNKS